MEAPMDETLAKGKLSHRDARPSMIL